MSRRALPAAIFLGAALCFTLGWLVSRAVDGPKREPTATPSSEPSLLDSVDGSPADPVLLIDPATIILLPDASLQFEPPATPVLPGQTRVRPD